MNFKLISKTGLIAFNTLLVIATLVYVKNSKCEQKNMLLKEDSVILAFGDSLIYGFGADEALSYLKIMQDKTGLKVINAGINGEFLSEGLERLPSLLNPNQSIKNSTLRNNKIFTFF
ncbi:MAG: hypothetical protein Q9M40_08405 [Sulfurimonas sp.]|nr:hypothetical protein [Sulfurimonas sp.]